MLLSALVAVAALSAGPALTADPTVGQLYECRSTDGAVTLTLVVGRVDREQGQTLVSVSMFNDAPGAPQPDIGHTPFRLSALAGCAQKSGERNLSANFERGYAIWREAVEEGGAGAFDEAPADTYQKMLEMVPPDAVSQPGRNDT